MDRWAWVTQTLLVYSLPRTFSLCIQRSGDVTTDKLRDLINRTWYYHYSSGPSSLLGFLLRNSVFGLFGMTTNKNISSQQTVLQMRPSEELEMREVEVVTFLAHNWNQGLKTIPGAWGEKDSPFCHWVGVTDTWAKESRRTHECFIRWCRFSAVWSWGPAAHAWTTLVAGLWVQEGKARTDVYYYHWHPKTLSQLCHSINGIHRVWQDS